MTGREGPINPDNLLKVQERTVGEVLDIGSGDVDVIGDTTLDADPDTDPDVVHDLSEGIPFDDNAFDTVTALHIIEHMEDDIALWEEMKRVASQRAIAIIPLGLRDDPDHEHVYDRKKAEERFDPDETELSSMASFFDLVMVAYTREEIE